MSSKSLKFQLPASRLIFLISVLLTLPFLAGCDTSGAGSAVAERGDKVAGTVDLEVNFNSDKRAVSVKIPCSSDSTVFSIMERARNLGDLKFESSGSGETAFIKSIGGVENGGATGDNWIYRINGELGDTSVGVCELKPGDKIQWRLGKYPK